MQYAIVVHRRGHDSEVAELVDKPKAEARVTARRMAERAFPDCRLRWSADCVMAFRDGVHQGDVSVEQPDPRPTPEPVWTIADAAMLSEVIDEMVQQIAKCTITDPDLVDPDFSSDGVVSGPDWLELHGFPTPRSNPTRSPRR